MFFTNRSISHQSLSSKSYSHHPPTPTTDSATDESTSPQDPYTSVPRGGRADITSEYSSEPEREISSTTASDEALSRVNSLDTAYGTETDSSPTIRRVLSATLLNPPRGKREQVRSAKLTRMGYPVTEQVASRTSPPTGSRKGFGALKSFMQTTFKGKA